MIGGMLGRINTAEKMTVEQLQQALQSESIPAYIGVPILEEKLNMRDRSLALAYGQQVAPQPPLIEEIMQRAQAAPNMPAELQGVDHLPTQMRPEASMAQGGIVAFQSGGYVGSGPYSDDRKRPLNWRTKEPYTDAEIEAGLHLQDDMLQPSDLEREAAKRLGGKSKGIMGGAGTALRMLNALGQGTKPVEREEREPDPILDGIVGASTYLGDKVQGAIDSPVGEAIKKWYAEEKDKPWVTTAREHIDRIGSTGDYTLGASEDTNTGLYKLDPDTGPSPTRDAPQQTTQAGPSAGAPPPPRVTGGPGAEAPPPPRVTGGPGAGAGAGIAALPSGLGRVGAGGIAGEGSPAPAPEPSALTRYIDMLMEEREGSAKEKEDAKYMALIEAGLSIAAGQSPYALTNIGEGAKMGLQAYNASIADISKRDRQTLEKALAAEMAIEDMGLKREMFASQKEFSQAQIDLKKAELGIRVAQASAAGGAGGFKTKDYITTWVNVYKAMKDSPEGMTMSDADMWKLSGTRTQAMFGMTPAAGQGRPEGVDAGQMIGFPTN